MGMRSKHDEENDRSGPETKTTDSIRKALYASDIYMAK